MTGILPREDAAPSKILPREDTHGTRFDGSVVDNLGPRAPSAGLQWSLHQYEVTATGSSATLSFQGTDPTATDGVGTDLDFVSLVPLVLRADPFTEIPGPRVLDNVVCPSPSVCIVTGFSPTTLTVITDGIPGPTRSSRRCCSTTCGD